MRTMADPVRALLRHPALFVTGTDTGVGKTVVSALIGRRWKREGHEVCAVKAVASGGKFDRAGYLHGEDAEALSAASTESGRELLQRLTGTPPGASVAGASRPMAPWSASVLDGKPFVYASILKKLRTLRRETTKQGTRLLVEGAGGALVPLGPNRLVVDLATDMELPAVIVARTELGTINHTLLTFEALATRGIETAAVVLSRQRRGVYTEVEKAGFRELRHYLPARIPLLLCPFGGRELTQPR